METIETQCGHQITIRPDADAMDPRDWSEQLIAVRKSNRYLRGDIDIDGYENYEDFVQERERLGDSVFPLYMYVHSGVALSTSPFGCQWDSGLAGAVVVPNDLKQHFCNDEEIQNSVESFLRIMTAWMNGDCYWYETSKNGMLVDSCSGYYSFDEAEQAAKENIA